MRRVGETLRRNLPTVLLLAGFNTLVYGWLNWHHLVVPHELPLSAIDRALPFWPWTLWPYLALLFSDILLPPLISDRAVFRRLVAGFLISIAIDAVIWAVYPTVYPRPSAPLGLDLSARFYRAAVGIDSPANCFPSAHISLPTVTCWALSKQFPRGRVLIWLGFALLSVSILTTKQHYFADLVSGLVSGAVAVVASRFVPAPSPRAAVE